MGTQEYGSCFGDLVLDNGEPGTHAFGRWLASSGPNPYGTDSLYSKEAGAEYQYTVPLPRPGKHEVLLWWTQYPSRLEAVPIIVQHALGSTTIEVNQRANSGQWRSLGTFEFGARAIVTIRSVGGGSTCADAVKLRSSP